MDTKALGILHYSKIRIKSSPITHAVPPGLLWKMVKTCLSDDGIGLAAPQVGAFHRIFIIRDQKDDGSLENTFEVFVNPRFTTNDSHKELGKEACLSVPGPAREVSRYTNITVFWSEKNSEGVWEEQSRVLVGFSARVFQHELDHLNALSIVDKALKVVK